MAALAKLSVLLTAAAYQDWGLDVVKSLFQLNLLGEMRSTSRLDTLAHAPHESVSALTPLFDAIAQDEGHHIRYTAAVLERACQEGHEDMVRAMLRDFQDSINQVTYGDLETDLINALAQEGSGHG